MSDTTMTSESVSSDAGGMNDVIERAVPFHRLRDVVLDEAKVLHCRHVFAGGAGGEQVVEANDLAGRLEHLPVETREHLGEITAEKSAGAGERDGLARQYRGGFGDAFDHLLDVGIEIRLVVGRHIGANPRFDPVAFDGPGRQAPELEALLQAKSDERPFIGPAAGG